MPNALKGRMRSALFALAVGLTAIIGGVAATPAYATTDDTAVTITAEASAINLPTTVTYEVKASVQSGSASMSGTVRTVFPAAITSIDASDPSCTQTGSHQIDCVYGSIAANSSQTWYLTGTVGLVGSLQLNVTSTLMDPSPADVVPANNADTATCTAILSLIILC